MTTSLDQTTVDFLLSFARLCYHLVRSGSIKMTATASQPSNNALTPSDPTGASGNNAGSSTGGGELVFPDLGGVSIDRDRAETFGLMTVGEEGSTLECEFRHLSLAEYLTALHVHVTGDSLKGFPRDRKELILQYLSGLASDAGSKDQVVVQDFLAGLGSVRNESSAMEYLKQIQKMRGEWYNQQGRLRDTFG